MGEIVVCTGVVPMSEEEVAAMPCSPKEFHIMKWAFPGTFERMEREEAAARIVSYSQKLDTWVGVTWAQLVEMMRQDHILAQTGHELQRQNELGQREFASRMRRHWFFSILTLGIYALCVQKPAEFTPVPPPDLPFSGTFMYGPPFVAEGVHELIDRGLIRYVKTDEDEGRGDILFPTPALVARILEVQGRQQATA